MFVDLKYGVTLEDYRDRIEPVLTRPLSLGGVNKRPNSNGELLGFQIKDIQKKPQSHSASMAKARAKRSL